MSSHLLNLAIASVALGVLVLVGAVIGRIRTDRPVCRRCRSDLRRWDEVLRTCPGCGADLRRAGAARFGPRVLRTRLVSLAGVLFAIGAVVTIIDRMEVLGEAGDPGAASPNPAAAGGPWVPRVRLQDSSAPDLVLARCLAAGDGWAVELVLDRPSLGPMAQSWTVIVPELSEIAVHLDGRPLGGHLRDVSVHTTPSGYRWVVIVDLAEVDLPEEFRRRRDGQSEQGPVTLELVLSARMASGERVRWSYRLRESSRGLPTLEALGPEKEIAEAAEGMHRSWPSDSGAAPGPGAPASGGAR